MRSFVDPRGTTWQAALLDASYGNVLIIFSPLQGSDVRQHLMDADNLAQAEGQLAGLTDHDLQGLLDNAEPWTPG